MFLKHSILLRYIVVPKFRPLMVQDQFRPVQDTPMFRARAPPPAMLPIIPPWEVYRKKPRKQKPTKRKKKKIWWDVPSEPLGEPWGADEYIVFGSAGTFGDPAGVAKYDKEKRLD